MRKGAGARRKIFTFFVTHIYRLWDCLAYGPPGGKKDFVTTLHRVRQSMLEIPGHKIGVIELTCTGNMTNMGITHINFLRVREIY